MMNVYLFLCVFGPCAVYELILTKKSGGESDSPLAFDGQTSPVIRCLWLLTFSAYLYLVLTITGIGTIWDIGKYDSFIRMDEINLSPFSDIREEQSFDFLNIMLFMPLGFLLSRIWASMRNIVRVSVFGFTTSLLIELCQLFNLRASDINDLIYNTLGAILGYLIWKLLHKRSVSAGKKRNQIVSLSRSEPVMIMLLSILGVFILYNPRAALPGTVTALNDVKITIRNTDTMPSPDEKSLDFEKDWVLENANLFPDGKAEKATDNPELCHFMFMLGNGDIPDNSDAKLDDSEVQGQIPYLFQWDKRWGFESYGKDNIGFSGCGPTCLAMILSSFKQNKSITPKYLADYAMEQDYYEPGAGTRWSFMQDVAMDFGVDAETIFPSEIINKLSDGHPVIVSVGKGHFTDHGHFLVLADLEDGKIRIHDPNSIQNTERLWDFDEFKSEVKNAWVYGEHTSQIVVTEHS